MLIGGGRHSSHSSSNQTRKPFESFLFEFSGSGGGLFGWTVALSMAKVLSSAEKAAQKLFRLTQSSFAYFRLPALPSWHSLALHLSSEATDDSKESFAGYPPIKTDFNHT